MIYMYSYNFHSLWLLCDFIIIFNVIYLINRKSLRHYFKTFLVLGILFAYLLYHSFSDLHLINFISFWDNYKHIFVFIFAFDIYKRIPPERKQKFIDRLYRYSLISFFIQMFFIVIQYQMNVGWDNMAGTFGNGSTHSVAYFSTFLTLFQIRYKKNILITATVIAMSLITSLWSENTGYFVMLGLILFFCFIDQISVFNLALIGLIAGFIILIAAKNEMAGYATNKITGFTLSTSYKGAEHVRPERGILMGYALYLGGWYGQGFGAYSEIYNIDGWLFHKLADKQLCISEGTHLVAEIGIVGLLITMVLFIVLFFEQFPDRKTRFFAITYLLLAMFHGRLFIDERLFFMFVLTFLVWQSDLYNKQKINHLNTSNV